MAKIVNLKHVVEDVFCDSKSVGELIFNSELPVSLERVDLFLKK